MNAAENNTVPSSSSSTELSSPIPIIDAGPAVAIGPAVVVTEPPPTPPAAPKVKSETIFAPTFPVVEADAQPSAEVEQEKTIEAEKPSEDTVAIPVLEVGSVAAPEPETSSTSKGPEPTLLATGSEPVRAVAESVAVPVAAESAVEPETTTTAEAIPTTAEVEAAAPTEADPPTRKAQPASSLTATESTTEPEVTPTSAEPFLATTEATPVPDGTPAPVVGHTSPVALAPEPNPPTGSLLEATAVEHVKVTDSPIVKGEKVTGVEHAAIAEPAVEDQVADTKLEEMEPEPIIEPVPATVVENIEPVESVSVVQRPLREIVPVSQELVPEPSVESTPVTTESTDAAKVDEIKPVLPGVTWEVDKLSTSELKADEVVEPTPTVVVAAVEARAPPAAIEPVATEPSPAVDEVTLTKEHGQTEANGSTTTDRGATDQISNNAHGAPPAATTSTQEAATHAEKFPSASASHLVSEDDMSLSSKFGSRRKKRTSVFGKLKNIFHQDKEKEKK